MKLKVESGISFVKAGGEKPIITRLSKAVEGIGTESGDNDCSELRFLEGKG